MSNTYRMTEDEYTDLINDLEENDWVIENIGWLMDLHHEGYEEYPLEEGEPTYEDTYCEIVGGWASMIQFYLENPSTSPEFVKEVLDAMASKDWATYLDIFNIIYGRGYSDEERRASLDAMFGGLSQRHKLLEASKLGVAAREYGTKIKTSDAPIIESIKTFLKGKDLPAINENDRLAYGLANHLSFEFKDGGSFDSNTIKRIIRRNKNQFLENWKVQE